MTLTSQNAHAPESWLSRHRWVIPAAVVLLLDQVTKISIERVTRAGDVHAIIPGLLNLVHTRNTGMAFSFFAEFDPAIVRPILIAFSVATIGLVIWFLRMPGSARPTTWGLSLVLGGAVGNLADRILRGSVFDFIDAHIGVHHWPAFNLADSAITIGAALVIWDLLFAREARAVRL